jgi:thiol:disulfide interchange protein DsbA
LALGASWAAGGARAAETYNEGQQYLKIDPPRPPQAPTGTVTITEVFSYGCPACNAFQPFMRTLQKQLPPRVVLDYLPASWLANEDWPVFQRAYLTAKVLGVAERTHDAMYAAIWHGGELTTVDPKTQELKSKLPTIEDVAHFYQRAAGVSPARFLEAAGSFAVEVAIRRSDELIEAYRAEQTPTLVVDGRYRIDPETAQSPERMIAVTLWLAQKGLSQTRSP